MNKIKWLLNKMSVTNKNVIADEFNEIFVNVDSNLDSEMPPANTNFEPCLPYISAIFAENSIIKKEF